MVFLILVFSYRIFKNGFTIKTGHVHCTRILWMTITDHALISIMVRIMRNPTKFFILISEQFFLNIRSQGILHSHSQEFLIFVWEQIPNLQSKMIHQQQGTIQEYTNGEYKPHTLSKSTWLRHPRYWLNFTSEFKASYVLNEGICEKYFWVDTNHVGEGWQIIKDIIYFDSFKKDQFHLQLYIIKWAQQDPLNIIIIFPLKQRNKEDTDLIFWIFN
ncbi:unnamed protein product (macronuclear) [Paramecium tetraurelia]|uniref:Uncharacterized protein n=1 Tax=Paramecium tetraurelia TaxID=5888 RepID=A0BS50_PARTE|nr:uncharacterized protein GSPATT00031598001 [Paramecium tetraurelia]CAK61367.1 unnamed protein product [Paramecium tetraurelia]|eukprot:XP_001428765.1 hypothetical protein (macronuclear) [Paramecium tetraurelia strain d4-2]